MGRKSNGVIAMKSAMLGYHLKGRWILAKRAETRNQVLQMVLYGKKNGKENGEKQYFFKRILKLKSKKLTNKNIKFLPQIHKIQKLEKRFDIKRLGKFSKV